MGLSDDTAVIFTTDHGFYFGEHGGLFGKMTYATRPEGGLYRHGDPDAKWEHSPLYEELVTLPLLIKVPGYQPGSYSGMSSAVDMMPTVLDLFNVQHPDWVEGRSLLPAMQDPDTRGRDFVVSTIPFTNPGLLVQSVDNISRPLGAGPMTTVTSNGWSLLHSLDPGASELYDLSADPKQESDLIGSRPEVAKELHRKLLGFLKDTNLPEHLLKPRLELRL
jgi:arylsulfatase A-like enzyme